jgi:hypothetical protein
MRYMIFVKSAESAGPPPPALMQGIAQLGEEAGKQGVLVQMGGLAPSALGARVRVKGGAMGVTDGPFTEAKEVVGGFATYDVPSKEEAIYWTRRFLQLHVDHWPEWEGECEIRAVFDAPPELEGTGVAKIPS